jgi:hypothetical protein
MNWMLPDQLQPIDDLKRIFFPSAAGSGMDKSVEQRNNIK